MTDPKIKYACDMLTSMEDALRQQFEAQREDIAVQRLRIATGLDAPEQAAKFLGVRWDYGQKPGDVIWSSRDEEASA